MKTLPKQQSNAALFRATWENVSREVRLPPVGSPQYQRVMANWRERGAPRSLTREFIKRLASGTGIVGQPDPSWKVSER